MNNPTIFIASIVNLLATDKQAAIALCRKEGYKLFAPLSTYSVDLLKDLQFILDEVFAAKFCGSVNTLLTVCSHHKCIYLQESEHFLQNLHSRKDLDLVFHDSKDLFKFVNLCKVWQAQTATQIIPIIDEWSGSQGDYQVEETFHPVINGLKIDLCYDTNNKRAESFLGHSLSMAYEKCRKARNTEALDWYSTILINSRCFRIRNNEHIAYLYRQCTTYGNSAVNNFLKAHPELQEKEVNAIDFYLKIYEYNQKYTGKFGSPLYLTLDHATAPAVHFIP